MIAVLFEKIDRNIALLTLNRPEAYNAINDEVAKRMEELVNQTENDSDIRVVILTGAGDKAFCAGADLKMIAAGRGEELGTEGNGFGGFVYAERTKPWIAAVNGFALAGGTEFCLACDIIVAAEGSKFGLPEVKRGLIAGAGGLFRLPQMIPIKIANEIIATGNHFDAELAHKYGLINKVVAKEKLMETALQLAKDIAANSPNSVAKSLAFMKAMEGKTEKQLMQRSNELFEEILSSDDAKEGTMAFVEKREPVWKA